MGKRSICCKILGQIGHGIALDRHACSGPGKPGGCSGIDADCVIHKIGGKWRVLNLGFADVPSELVDNGPDHFQVSQFLCTWMGVRMTPGAENDSLT